MDFEIPEREDRHNFQFTTQSKIMKNPRYIHGNKRARLYGGKLEFATLLFRHFAI